VQDAQKTKQRSNRIEVETTRAEHGIRSYFDVRAIGGNEEGIVGN
jgi:hypothetical protein